MEYKKVEGDKRKTFVFLAGDFGYVKNKKVGDILYVKCKHKPLCDGTAKINLMSELLEPGRGHVCQTKSENFDHLPALEKMRKAAATTQQPLRQIYFNIIRNCPVSVQNSLTFRKCEQKLQAARRTNYNINPVDQQDANILLSQVNPFSEIYKGKVEFEDQIALIFCSTSLLPVLSGNYSFFLFNKICSKNKVANFFF